MEKFMQGKNVSMEYATAQDQGFPGNSLRIPNRSLDEMDFNDVFGGPPRRFSVQEVGARYSFGGADSEEERVSLPWSKLKEKPVFGEESTGRRRNHQVDDFYDDIFRGGGGDESYSSPRRGDRDRDSSFGSNPDSRIPSPSPRPLPPKVEPFSSSLPAQSSFTAKLTKSMDLPTFGSRNHNQFKMDGSGSQSNSPHSSNGLSRFSSPPFTMKDEIRNSVERQSPLSRETSTDDLLSAFSYQKKDRVENSRKDVKNNDGSGDHFHFSIYKWAGKGVPMLMPFVLRNNSKTKAVDRSTSFSEKRESDFMSKLSNIMTDEGRFVNMDINSLKVESEKNDTRNQGETKEMPEPIEETLYDTLSSNPGTDLKNNVAFGGTTQNLKGDEAGSLNEVAAKEKIEEEIPMKIKSQGKPLKVFLTDEIEQSENKEKKIRTPKGTRSNNSAVKNLKKNEETGNDSTNAGVDKSSLDGAYKNSGVTPGKSGVKGKVKEFVQIFNVENDSNPKADFRARSQSFRWNAAGINQKDNKESHPNAVDVKEKENLLDADKTPNVSMKVDENLNKDKVEQFRRRTSQNYRIRRNSVSQKHEYSSESIHEDSVTVEEIADDLFEEHFQIEELSDDYEKITEKEEDPNDTKVIDAKIRQWSVGKKGNIRSLLSTLQYVLWPGSGWTPVPLMDLIEANAVKRAYQKALLRLHPDKLQQKGAASYQKYTAERVFDLLQEAWDHFNTLTPL